MTTNVLLIDDYGGPYLLDTIRCLSYEQAVNIFVVSPEKKTYFNTIPYSRYVTKYQYLKSSDPKEIIQEISALEKKWDINMILPVKFSNYQFITKYRRLFNGSVFPPMPTQSTFATVTNKFFLAEFLVNNSFPSPKTKEISGDNIQQFNFPLLLKPRTDFEENRIMECKSREEYEEKISNIDFKADDYVIQEKLNGEDIDISLLAENGEILAYTIQKGLVREAYSFATGIEFLEDQKLLDATKAIVKQLNWSGIAHLDFIYRKETDSYLLIDFNPRMWSTLIGSLYAGVNFPGLMISRAHHKEISFEGYQKTKFYLAKAALQSKSFSVLKTSSWQYIVKDPLPEIAKGIARIFYQSRGD
ncbi:ATP-grasp domain-containing protein [Marinifilum sp. D737]|uniref:ATP-grasp domain-containing protein n=1 Tax=Marinifilum sp. D737 TaxID=2969628 RepID=UPI002276EFC2|nr:ATP-grasp domain-containing protein [Marinifilum sp. D737]MCY1635640.1 ATP-grasp domain-containing protein [Marinifilum sp. D737]